jgi:hypothetical protein
VLLVQLQRLPARQLPLMQAALPPGQYWPPNARQFPPTQRWPSALHSEPAPHLQALPEQPSASGVAVSQSAVALHVHAPAVQVVLAQDPPALQRAFPTSRQLPPAHRAWTGAHASLVDPHTQPPPLQVSAKEVLHAAQVVPAGPQLLVEGDMQVLPAQQPAQPTASQVQVPPTQCCPGEQGAPAPQRHIPEAQRSVRTESHAVQAPPPLPHADCCPTMQLAPAQHPFAQEDALQTQVPPEQAWPAPHEGPAPQRHAPLVQESAFVASQATQDVPPLPQVGIACAWQILLLSQQPLGQFIESQVQTPLAQRCPDMHALPQAPQFLMSMFVLISQPSLRRSLLQSPKPGLQVPVQVPPVHAAVMFCVEQAILQPPQLAGSAAMPVSQPSLRLSPLQSA